MEGGEGKSRGRRGGGKRGEKEGGERRGEGGRGKEGNKGEERIAYLQMHSGHSNKKGGREGGRELPEQ